jgi:hypothetical protein
LERGLSLEINWFDDDVLSLQVCASNGRFGGTADVYGGLDALSQVANAFRAFPIGLEDHRELELGTFNPAFAGGGARLHLRCVGKAGIVVLHVHLRAASQHDDCEEAEFMLRTEAAQIDDFVAQLDAVKEVQVGAVSRLRVA